MSDHDAMALVPHASFKEMPRLFLACASHPCDQSFSLVEPLTGNAQLLRQEILTLSVLFVRMKADVTVQDVLDGCLSPVKTNQWKLD